MSDCELATSLNIKSGVLRARPTWNQGRKPLQPEGLPAQTRQGQVRAQQSGGADLTHSVCLVYQDMAPFVEADWRLLSERFTVRPFKYRGKRDLPTLAKAIQSSDIVYSWFALGHATAAVRLARFFGRKSIVISGGWDVAALPELPYGAMLGPERRRRTIWTLRNADLVLSVSESNQIETLRWVSRDIPVVPLGVDTNFFAPVGPKQDLVVTVARVTHDASIPTKGVDTFMQIARELPQCRFVLVGGHSPEWGERLRRMASANVELAGWLEREAIRSLFQRARLVVQFSAHESFGLSVAEAMSCECTPIVCDRGALPSLVGTTGTIVPYGSQSEALFAVQKAMRSPGNRAARDRICRLYSLERRRKTLLQLVETLL